MADTGRALATWRPIFIGAFLVVVVCMAQVGAARGRQPASPAELPPLSWTCPMHPEVVETAKGICPICKMDLVAVRLDSIWSCPVHSIVTESKPGTCPICRRDLVQMTVAVSFTCPDRPEIDQIEPGACPDGKPMVKKYAPRAHGNHNPLHGGLFFMAPDNWHHLEGTYPDRGVFRLHLYDDYTKPLAADKMKQVTGRIVTKETFDPATNTTREIVAFPLELSPGNQYLEANTESLGPPAEMTAKVRLTADGPEYRFDFVFPAFSKDPAADDQTAAGIATTQASVEIPSAAPDVVVELSARSGQLQSIIERGAFSELWVPALQGKDLALALDAHAAALPPEARSRAVKATRRVVISAWRLDAYGDLGNRQQITDAYASFAAAVKELETLFGGKP